MPVIRSIRSLLCHALVLTFVLGTTGRAQGLSAGDSILFAGVAFLDDTSRFPVVSAVMRGTAREGQPMNTILRKALQRANIPVKTSFANSNRETALVFAFDDEYRVLDRYGSGQVKVITGISGQLLTIDFDNQVVKSAFPFSYEYIDVVQAEPSAGYDEQVASTMIPAFLDSSSTGVFQDLIEMMQGLPSINARCTARISGIIADTGTFSAGAVRFGADSARLIRYLGNVMSRQLTTSARFPLLPMSNSRARSAMQARFANGEIYNLQIPQPDFDLTIENFRTRRAVLGQNGSRRVDATGVQFALKVSALETGIARGEFRHILVDTVPVSKSASDPWPSVVSATKILTARVGANTLRRDKKWYDANEISKAAFPALPDWLLGKCVAP